jgi:hypothetical protein
MKKIFAISILLLVGLSVLAGYFFPKQLSPILSLIIDWGILLVGTAGLIGIGYLIKNHVQKLGRREKGSFFSVILLVAFLATLISGLVLSIQHPFFVDLMINVQLPVETSLLAILAVVLLAASFRLIRTRGWTPMSIAFLSSSVFTLALDVGSFYYGSGTVGVTLLNFLRRLPLVGARGVLIGMALGGLIVGLRVLLTIDKPYGE